MNNMTKILLLTGGIVNAIFTLFHFYLHYQLYKLKNLPAHLYALLLMLNLGGILIILFFTLAFLFYSREVLATKLGGLALLFCSIFYGTRCIGRDFSFTSFFHRHLFQLYHHFSPFSDGLDNAETEFAKPLFTCLTFTYRRY